MNHPVPAQVGATLHKSVKIVAETADWDASIYATCPQTADGEFVDCVRVLLESVQPPYDGANQGRTRERNSQLQSLISRPFSTRFG